MNEWADVVRIFEYCDTNDLAVAFTRVMEQEFGKDPFRRAWVAWYKRAPAATFMTVKTGPNNEVTRAVRGTIGVKGVKGFFEVGGEEGQPVLSARVLKREQLKVEGLFVRVQEHLKTKSIYKGKVFTSGRNFIDLSNVDLTNLVYNAKVHRELKAYVWTPLEKPERCLKAGIPPQRKILFAGPFGGGKTMAVLLTARIATQRGWTVIYLEPTIQQASGAIPFLMEFARKYQPTLVIIDDVDREQREGDQFAFGRILSAVDGTLTKDGQVMVLMTTNYPEKLASGIQRPGRIDRVIDFGLFTPSDGVKLLQAIIPDESIGPDIQWSQVENSCRDYMPAFVNEVATSAKLLAISETEDDQTIMVTEEMLVTAANDLRKQHEACTQGGPGFKVNR